MKKILALTLTGVIVSAQFPALAAQAPAPGAQPTGAVSGGATSNTGRPLPGITIQVRNAAGAIVGSAVTGSGGNYTVAALPAGAYTIECLSEKKQVIGTARATLTPPSATANLICAFDAAGLPILNKKVLTALGAAAVAIGAVAVVSTRSDGSPAR
jgi:large repetitive protein